MSTLPTSPVHETVSDSPVSVTPLITRPLSYLLHQLASNSAKDVANSWHQLSSPALRWKNLCEQSKTKGKPKSWHWLKKDSRPKWNVSKPHKTDSSRKWTKVKKKRKTKKARQPSVSSNDISDSCEVCNDESNDDVDDETTVRPIRRTESSTSQMMIDVLCAGNLAVIHCQYHSCCTRANYCFGKNDVINKLHAVLTDNTARHVIFLAVDKLIGL